MIDSAGEVMTTFKFNGQEVYRSCGVVFQNKQYLYGGQKYKKQILQISNCDLISIGSFSFFLEHGACGSTDETIFLCFNSNEADTKRCRQASSPTGPWTPMALSDYDHQYISIANSSGYLWSLFVSLTLTSKLFLFRSSWRPMSTKACGLEELLTRRSWNELKFRL